MVKDWPWTRESLEGIGDFDVEQDLFLAVMMYCNKTGTDVNQRYPLEPYSLFVSSNDSPGRNQTHRDTWDCNCPLSSLILFPLY